MIVGICLRGLYVRGTSPAPYAVQAQVELPIIYGGRNTGGIYRLDLIVADGFVVELKAIKRLLNVHEVQLLTYLKLNGKHVGLMINCNVPILQRGIMRRVL